MTNITCSKPLTEPIKFLGLTVLSFNGSLGWGTQESSLNVDLVEDCVAGDAFTHSGLIGHPVFFSANDGAFEFNGVLTSWTKQSNQGGITYNVRVNDPRQLLENTIVVVDTYAGPPVKHVNYFNAYAQYEQSVYTNNNCDAFTTSTNGSSIERGMPYINVLTALQNIDPTICSSTGAVYTIDLSSLLTLNLPDYFRVSGPTTTILQLIQDVCDANGAEFYVTLNNPNVIKVNPIIFQPAAGLDALTTAYDGVASDISYGKELTNNKVKTIIFGAQQHYLTYSDKFKFYFGEDINGNPIVPVDEGECGFVIEIDLKPLNLSLYKPLGANTARLTEYEIRSAMSSEALWKSVVFNGGGDTFAAAIRAAFPDVNDAIKDVINRVLPANLAGGRALVDMIHDIRLPVIEGEKFDIANEIKKVHQFVVNIGNTFYGKKFLVELPDNICVVGDPDNFKERIYSAEPTNDGGWVEPADIGGPKTLLLNSPEIQIMMQDDARIGAFATFPKSPPPSSVIPVGDSSVTPPDELDDYVPGGGGE